MSPRPAWRMSPSHLSQGAVAYVGLVAAAADYWFDAATSGSGLRAVLSGIGLRPWACQALCGAFPG